MSSCPDTEIYRQKLPASKLRQIQQKICLSSYAFACNLPDSDKQRKVMQRYLHTSWFWHSIWAFRKQCWGSGLHILLTFENLGWMNKFPETLIKGWEILLQRLHLPSWGEGFIYYCCESIAIVVVGWKSIFNGINKGAFITKSYRWQIVDERDAHQIYNFPRRIWIAISLPFIIVGTSFSLAT